MTRLDVTMVAFRGACKPRPLRKLLHDLREEIAAFKPGVRFEPYADGQIHATLIGMEVDVIGGRFYSHWFAENKRVLREIDIHRFLAVIGRIVSRNPLFTVRFGGFARAHCSCVGQSACGWTCRSSDAEFHSCDQSPYDSSLYAYSPGPVILTGWPVESAQSIDVFPRSLYDFRLAAERAGFLDKYHGDQNPHWMDDDCYIKIGNLPPNIKARQLRHFQRAMREYLRKSGPVTVTMRLADVSIVLYRNPSMGRGSVVEEVRLRDALINHRRLEALFSRLAASRC